MNTYVGWNVSDENIRDLYRRKEQKKEQRKKWEEFREKIIIPELMNLDCGRKGRIESKV